MNVGVILPNWVGDLAMATPALRTLRQHLPEARMVGVSRPYLTPLLDGSPWLDAILPWEHHGRGWMGRTWRLVNQLRAERLDWLVILRSSFYANLVGRLSQAKRVVGNGNFSARWLLTDPIAPLGKQAEPESAVDGYLRLLSAAGFHADSRELELAARPADDAAANGIWQRMGLPAGEQVMLLNVGGAYGAAKHWPAEYCVSLALRAAKECGLTTLVLCGPREREAAAAIEQAAGHPQVRSLAGEDVSFGTTKAVIRRSRLLVTTDSGPRHIAAAMGTPTVVLFGPIDPRMSRNYQRQSIELRVDLECSPCGRRVCPLGHHKCMRDLSVDRVLRAVGQTLKDTRANSRAA